MKEYHKILSIISLGVSTGEFLIYKNIQLAIFFLVWAFYLEYKSNQK
jgi:hypothetical protein